MQTSIGEVTFNTEVGPKNFDFKTFLKISGDSYYQ